MGNYRNEEIFVDKMFPILEMILSWYQKKQINRKELRDIWIAILELDRINITDLRKGIWLKALDKAVEAHGEEIEE